MPPNVQFLDDWLLRTCELVDHYQPQLVWFDWWIEQPVFEPYLQRFAAYYYNRASEWSRGVVINLKHDAFAEDAAVLDVERGQLAGINPRLWQTDTSVGTSSWGFVNGHDYKSAAWLPCDLVDVVSKNGVFCPGGLEVHLPECPAGPGPFALKIVPRTKGRWLRPRGAA